jgi:hypothetical protein
LIRLGRLTQGVCEVSDARNNRRRQPLGARRPRHDCVRHGQRRVQDDFRGCAFQNAAAETPETGHRVRQATYDYALEIKDYLRRTANDAGLPRPARTAEELHLLAQGAIATAVATRSPDAAKVARAAAKRILAPPRRPLA